MVSLPFNPSLSSAPPSANKLKPSSSTANDLLFQRTSSIASSTRFADTPLDHDFDQPFVQSGVLDEAEFALNLFGDHICCYREGLQQKELTVEDFQGLVRHSVEALQSTLGHISKELESHNTTSERLRREYFVHEIRNTLNTALSAHQLIRRGCLEGELNPHAILERALIRLGATVSEFQREAGSITSTVQTGTHTVPAVTLSACSLVDTFSTVRDFCMIDPRTKAIHLEMPLPEGLYVRANAELLFSALSNLVKNAVLYTKPDTTVSVRCRTRAGRIFIYVSDRCGGLPPGDPAELFKPFHRGHSHLEGSGLGLAIVAEAVGLMNGEVRVENFPDVGCRFTLDLPSVIHSL